MKVGQIARRLAEYTHRKFQPQQIDHLGGLDPEVAEAAALAHDIGHPPFGHATERTLDELVRNEGCHDGFEGNAQSFRVITKLAFTKADPDTPPGLDLTRATLRAVLKYPWLRDLDSNNHPRIDSDRSKKWSAYETELEDFKFAMELQPADENQRSLEAEIMDWADDVTYAVHDLEDFYRANLIPLLTLIMDEDGEVMVQPEGRTLAEILKYLTRKYVIDAPSLNAQRYGHRRIITELFDAYCDIGSKSGPNSTPLNTPFFDRKFYLECHSARRAADFIASLTDDQAIRLYRRITGQSLDSIHLPIA